MVPTIIFSVLDPGAAGDRRIAVSRAGLLARAAVVGGGVVAGGIAITGFPGIALGSPSPEQDAQVLDLLLQLEYVQAAFYEDANKRGSLKGELAEFSRIVGGHEDEHVAFLKNALGSKASPKPRVDFRGATRDEKAFTAAAIALEDLGVAAYNGQATNITRTTLAPATTIVSVEARHAAWIRDIAGLLPAIAATDPAATAAQLRNRLGATGYVKPS